MEKSISTSKPSEVTEEQPPQYAPSTSQAKFVAISRLEDLHPVLVHVFISDVRTEVYYDKRGVWASKVQDTKRAYVVDINLKWPYEDIQKQIRVSIAENKDRPTGFLAGAGIEVVRFEKLSVVWNGPNEDWTEIKEDNYRRVLRMMELRGWTDIIKVTYKDLGQSPAKFAEKGEGSNKARNENAG